jgi:hypothetical protein
MNDSLSSCLPRMGAVPRSFCSVREALDSTPTGLLALALDHKLFFYSGLYPPCDTGERHSDEAANFTRHDITVVYDVFAKVTDGRQVEIRDRAMHPSDRIKR